MKKPPIPVHTIGRHCEIRTIQNFKISAFDESACTIAEFQENHRHDFYEIVWLRNGRGVHQIDLKDYPYTGSVIFLLSPGQIHHITQTTRSEGYVIKFTPDLFGRDEGFVNYILDTFLAQTATSCRAIPVSKDLRFQFDELFANLVDEFQAEQGDSRNIFSSYLRILLTQINRLTRGRLCAEFVIRDPQYALFRSFQIALEKNHSSEHTVGGYAKLLNTRPRVLNRIARIFGNKSASAMIHERVLLEARRHLYHGALTIKEVCYSLGFDDPAYFTRFFKRLEGVGPQQFRRRFADDRHAHASSRTSSNRFHSSSPDGPTVFAADSRGALFPSVSPPARPHVVSTIPSATALNAGQHRGQRRRERARSVDVDSHTKTILP